MRRGFTVFELLAVVVISVILVAFLLPALGRSRPGSSRQLKDSTQIRGISQSMVVWANSNNGDYPLPSQIDTADFTVTESGRAKDTTANIFSILIFNGNISPEICISPAESNRSIARDEDYEYSNPKAAASSMNALWDPAFAADFTAAKGGNLSYGHLQPSGTRGNPAATDAAAREPTGRLSSWRDTFSTSEAILANRGPEIASIAANYTPKLKNTSSNTFLIHGGRSTWEGNVAYNDGHVAFETTLKPLSPGGTAMKYTTASGTRSDVIFYDEPDDQNQSNIYLGIFITAGEKPSEFKGIWD